MSENELAKIVFNAGLKVHKVLGPGLLGVRVKPVSSTNCVNRI